MKIPAYAIILAGGYGTRFWPASRRARPKQFLALAGGQESLLERTYRRVARLFPPQRIFVVACAEHRALLRRQLRRMPARHLLLEPLGRNTAVAIALAAEHLRAELPARQPDALLAVFPADHAIQNEARFRRVVRAALAVAAGEGAMVVLGLPPSQPHTGYGYIERGPRQKRVQRQAVFTVRCFKEKPDRKTAVGYLRAGRFYWNSGMFFWRLSTFDRLLRQNLPKTKAAMEKLAGAISGRGYAGRLRRVYRRLENISVDYAIAEPAAARGQGRLLVADIGWSDLGSWAAVYDWRARGGQNIVAAPRFLLDASGNWLEAPGKFIAAIGVHDLILVETPDALLLCPRARAEEVGKIVKHLQKTKGEQWL